MRTRGFHLSLAVLASFCSLVSQSQAGPRHADPAPAPSGRYVQTGKASWYGGAAHHGGPTASGQRYDQNAMTAAHPTLPMGTRVWVTRLETGRSVQVEINDRGPFLPGRLIDLSRRAASDLGMLGQGVAPVRVESAPPPVDVAEIPDP